MLLDYTKTAKLVSWHPPHEIARRLTVETTPTKWYDIFTVQQFVGEIHADNFRIKPTGRNSLLIEGNITVLEPERSLIILRFTNGLSDKLGRIVFVAVSGLFLLLMRDVLLQPEGPSWPLLAFALMPALMGIGMGHINCVIASSCSTAQLQKLLAAQEMPEAASGQLS